MAKTSRKGDGREPNVHRSLQRQGLRRDEALNCSVQTQLENTLKHIVLVLLKSRSDSRIAVLSNTIKMRSSFTTLVIRKTGEELYSKTYQSPTVPQRIVLKPNLNCERQDTRCSYARTSFDHSSKHKENCHGGRYRETCRGEIDFRIHGLLHSAVQERKEAVQKMIHQFETHPNKEALQADLKQNRAFNPFSEQSKEMIYSMGNMEYSEICEITPKIQRSNCMTYWPKGVVYCTCGHA